MHGKMGWAPELALDAGRPLSHKPLIPFCLILWKKFITARGHRTLSVDDLCALRKYILFSDLKILSVRDDD